MKEKKVQKYTTGSKILTALFVVLCLVWVFPILEVVFNSFKSNNAINLDVFALPNKETFVGLANYLKGLTFGDYPFLNNYYVLTAAGLPENAPAKVLYDWILSEEGQKLVAHEGYVSVLDVGGAS